MSNLLKLYGRAEKIKNMLEFIMDTDKKVSVKQCEEAYYKLGEALYIIQGDRRENR